MTKTIDFAQLITVIFVVLLMVGVIPFTPIWVGIIILLTMFELKVSWS